MKNLILILLLLTLYISTQAQYYLKKNFIELQQKENKLFSVEYRNLKIIPLFAGSSFVAANNDVGKYKTLKEVLGDGKVEIKETGAVGNRRLVRYVKAHRFFLWSVLELHSLVLGQRLDYMLVLNKPILKNYRLKVKNIF